MLLDQVVLNQNTLLFGTVHGATDAQMGEYDRPVVGWTKDRRNENQYGATPPPRPLSSGIEDCV